MTTAPKGEVRHAANQAFSLVEVVMALAILSVALVTVLGLVPVGLLGLRQAISSTTEAEIVGQLTAQIRLTPFSQLDAYQNTSFFYDEEGVFLSSAASVAGAPAQTRYWATASQNPVIYPGCDLAPAASPVAGSVKIITLQFMSGPNPQAAPLATNNYVILVPNSGT
jgi:uncharacterized protein (TIGR02598 family)